MCWIFVFLGPLDLITHDAGKQFMDRVFWSNSEMLRIQTKSVPIESPNSISYVKRYHVAVSRAYNIIKNEAPDTDSKQPLQISEKSLQMNLLDHTVRFQHFSSMAPLQVLGLPPTFQTRAHSSVQLLSERPQKKFQDTSPAVKFVLPHELVMDLILRTSTPLLSTPTFSYNARKRLFWKALTLSLNTGRNMYRSFTASLRPFKLPQYSRETIYPWRTL